MKRRDELSDNGMIDPLLLDFDAFCEHHGVPTERDTSRTERGSSIRAEQTRAWTAWATARHQHFETHGWPGGLTALKSESYAAHPPDEPFDPAVDDL